MGMSIWSTSVSELSYRIAMEVDPVSRIIIGGQCPCVAGVTLQCKNGADLFSYVNQERSEMCTDSSWQSKAHSKSPLKSTKKAKKHSSVSSETTKMFRPKLSRSKCWDPIEGHGVVLNWPFRFPFKQKIRIFPSGHRTKNLSIWFDDYSWNLGHFFHT